MVAQDRYAVDDLRLGVGRRGPGPGGRSLPAREHRRAFRAPGRGL